MQNTLQSLSLALWYSVAEYCCPAWAGAAVSTDLVDVQLNYTLCIIIGTLRSAPLSRLRLPVLANNEPPALRCKDAVDRLIEKTALHENWLLHKYVFSFLQLSAITQTTLDRHSSHRRHQSMARLLEVGLGGQTSLVDDPTIWRPEFDLPWWYWSKLNHFRTNQGHCASCHNKCGLATSDKCQCGKRQTMFQIVNSCPQTKLEGGLPQLHLAEEWRCRYSMVDVIWLITHTITTTTTTMWHCLHDDTFSRFNRTLDSDKQTDKQTDT